MKEALLCLFLTVFSGLRCLAAESATNTVPPLNTTNLLIKIRWNGAVTKTVSEAAWGTTNRLPELDRWRFGALGSRFTATLSPQEIQELEHVFADLGGFKGGTLPLGTYTQEYVIEVSAMGAEHYRELPFSKKTVMPVLQRIRACLSDQSKLPIDHVIRQVEGWMVWRLQRSTNKSIEPMTSSAACQWFEFNVVDALLVTAHPGRSA